MSAPLSHRDRRQAARRHPHLARLAETGVAGLLIGASIALLRWILAS